MTGLLLVGSVQAQDAELYTYDALGRLTSVQRPNNIVTTYQFDAAGNRAGVTTYNPMETVWQAEALPHVIGYAIGDGWGGMPSQGFGFITYGPYTAAVPTGLNIASWRISIDSNTYPDTGNVVVLDVWDATANVQLGWLGLDRHQWMAGDTYQNFELPFVLPADSAGHLLEFRTWYTALAAVAVDEIGYRQTGRAWPAATDPNIYHIIGYAAADGWAADTGQPSGHMTFGPYVTNVPAGSRTALWRGKIDDNTAPDPSAIMTLEIWDATANQFLGTRNLNRQAWRAANVFQVFEMPFILDPGRVGHQLEFRTFYHGAAAVTVNWVGYR